MKGKKNMNTIFTTKKSVLRESVKNNKELFLLPGFLSVIIGIPVIGWLFNLLGFTLVANTYKNGLLTYFLNGFVGLLIFGLLLVLISFLIYIFIIHPTQKQLAVCRYCKLPLTEGEIHEAMKKGLFSNVEEYMNYLDEQMRYTKDEHLFFTDSEIVNIINTCWKVFNLKDTDYFTLPTCVTSNGRNIFTRYITGFENGVFCAHQDFAKEAVMPAIPITSRPWVAYGSAYAPKEVPIESAWSII